MNTMELAKIVEEVEALRPEIEKAHAENDRLRARLEQAEGVIDACSATLENASQIICQHDCYDMDGERMHGQLCCLRFQHEKAARAFLRGEG